MKRALVLFAILAFAVLAFAQGASDNAANKVHAVGSTLEIAGPNIATTLLRTTLKTSNVADLLIEFNTECAIAIWDYDYVSDLADDIDYYRGSIVVWVEIDGQPVPVNPKADIPDDGQVVFYHTYFINYAKIISDSTSTSTSTSASTSTSNSTSSSNSSSHLNVSYPFPYTTSALSWPLDHNHLIPISYYVSTNTYTSTSTSTSTYTNTYTNTTTDTTTQLWENLYREFKEAKSFKWFAYDVGKGTHTIEVKATLVEWGDSFEGYINGVVGNRTLVVEPLNNLK